jgi:ABC-type Fe3+ transport system permease subunit
MSGPHARTRALDAIRLALTLGVVWLPVLHLVLVALGASAEGDVTWRLDARALGLLGRSLAIAASASLGALVLGLGIGIPLARLRFSGRRPLAMLLLAVFAFSPYWIALGWLQGDLGSVAAQLLIARPAAVAFVLATAHAPAAALWVLLAARSVPIGWEEAGLLAAPLPHVLRRILLPQLRPLLGVALLLVFALCLSDYAVASLLQVPTYPVEIFLLYAGAFAPGQAARACMPLLGVAALVAVLLGTLIDRGLAQHWPAAVLGSWPVTRWQRHGLLALALALMLSCTAWPVLGLLSRLETAPGTLLALRAGAPALANSLATAACAVALALALGSAASGALLRAKPRSRCALAMLLLVPLCLPGSAYAIAWVELSAIWPRALKDPLASLPALLPALCIAARWSGPVALLMTAARLALPRGAIEAAFLQEGSRLRRFLRIELPLVAPVVLASCAILFALSQSAVGILVLTAPPGFEVATLRIDNLLHYGASEQAVALAIASAALAAIAPLVLAGVARSVWRRTT